VTADRSRFDSLALDGVAFPTDLASRTLALDEPSVLLDRHSLPGDPGISRSHGELVRTSEGYALVDRGSLNGTAVNNALVPSRRRVLLHDGDRVQLGAWTMLTIRLVRREDDDDND
jgi:hypothetical protein